MTEKKCKTCVWRRHKYHANMRPYDVCAVSGDEIKDVTMETCNDFISEDAGVPQDVDEINGHLFCPDCGCAVDFAHQANKVVWIYSYCPDCGLKLATGKYMGMEVEEAESGYKMKEAGK